jgi:putative ABC transport system permease protein
VTLANGIMNVLPLVRALRRNRAGPILIGVQIALTLVIVCNSMFIIQQYLRHMNSPTGIDEANIFTLTNAWLVTPNDLEARIKGDLAAIRAMPGVLDAVATLSYPLAGYEVGISISPAPGPRQPHAGVHLYDVDEHGLAAYGLKLVAGRWFTSTEVLSVPFDERRFPAETVVTAALATRLFRTANALGQVFYLYPDHPCRIVGIVERAHNAVVSYRDEDSIFLPVLPLNNALNYVVRTRPGQQASALQSVDRTLYSLSRQRVIQNMRPYLATRHRAYTEDRANAVILGVVCVLMLSVTAFGVIGLTTYWVTQRRQHIGMRRALGARRVDIFKQFQAENLLIASAGCLVGIVAGLAGNLWLLSKLDGLQRMSPSYICIVAIIVIVLCQFAVLWPAFRAAAIPPAQAIRNL